MGIVSSRLSTVVNSSDDVCTSWLKTHTLLVSMRALGRLMIYPRASREVVCFLGGLPSRLMDGRSCVMHMNILYVFGEWCWHLITAPTVSVLVSTKGLGSLMQLNTGAKQLNRQRGEVYTINRLYIYIYIHSKLYVHMYVFLCLSLALCCCFGALSMGSCWFCIPLCYV